MHCSPWEDFIPSNGDLLTEYHSFTHGTLVWELTALPFSKSIIGCRKGSWLCLICKDLRRKNNLQDSGIPLVSVTSRLLTKLLYILYL